MEKPKGINKNIVNETKTGGYRIKVDNYNHIINDYQLRMSLVKESNVKLKKD